MHSTVSERVAERPFNEDEIFVTDDLHSRPAKKRNYRREKAALQSLAERLGDDPEGVLPHFVELAMELTGASSAGLSIYEPVPGEAGIFRWHHVHGALAPFEHATTPRDDSPCGVTLDRNGPVLAARPERRYEWIAEAGLAVAEVLLVPLYIGSDEPHGTLWVVGDESGHFRTSDATVATELAKFVGIALRMVRSESRLRESLRQQELLAREMGHRVKNVFAVTEGIVRLTAGRADTASELAESLSRRLAALSAAHSLARGNAIPAGADIDLSELVEAIVGPFNPGRSRFSISGPAVDCGASAATAIALVVHELATNAAKYGALSAQAGVVEIRWESDGETLELSWREVGGPQIEGEPETNGFGSTLILRTVTRQFSGELDERWLPGGLECRMRLPLAKLAN